jgi:hypothetical protein
MIPPHEVCAEALRQTMAALGAEVRVQEHSPPSGDIWTAEPWTCPHGTRYWPYPTRAQQKQWLRRQRDQS